MRLLGWLVAVILVAALAGVAYGGWQMSRALDAMLTAGTPIGQGKDAPVPAGPADIGFVGDPQAAFGYPFRAVEFTTDLGPTPAWLVEPDGEGASTDWAIFVHGISGARENGYRFLPTLRAAGLPVLMMAYRNDPGAPKAPDGLYALGLAEWRDLDAAVRFALDNGARSIVLVGESMGGGIIGQFLRQSDSAGRVRAIVLDAPMVDFPASVRTLMTSLGAPLPGVLAPVAIWLSSLRHSTRLSDAVVVAALAEFAGPLFLSHGAADRIVPVSTSDDLVARRRGSTVYLRTQADHIQSYRAGPAAYERQLAAFLSTLDRGEGRLPR